MEKLCIFLIILSSLSTISISTEAGEGDEWIEVFNSRSKTADATLHFYMQDVLAGPNATVWEVGRASITSKSSTSFGLVRVIDNLITSGPDPNKSNKLGRAQGMVTNCDLNRSGIFVVDMMLTFDDSGWSSGSSISVSGRIRLSDDSVELIVSGGTGVFQMARGYVNCSIYSMSFDDDHRATYVVLEYYVALYHPCKS